MTTQSVFPVGGTAGAWRGEIRDTSRLETLLTRLRERFQTWKIYRRTLDELRMLDDRELDDIGIHRADIRRIAREAAELEGPRQIA